MLLLITLAASACVLEDAEGIAEEERAAYFTPEGCVWDGYWQTWWEGRVGDNTWYPGNLFVGSTPTGSQAWGGYSDSHSSWAQVGEIYNASVSADGYTFSGYWKRTSGSSGGACQFGRFHLRVYRDSVWGRCQMGGNWTYCHEDPQYGSQRRMWVGTYY